MLTIEALRALYVKMGGNAADVADLELTPDIIEAIKTLYTSGLPAVTSEDNGLGLIVSGGAWNKGALPIGLPAVTDADNGKTPIVDGGVWTKGILPTKRVFSYDYDQGEDKWVCSNGTLRDIATAYYAGVDAVAHVTMADMGITVEARLGLCGFNAETGVGDVVFTLPGALNGSPVIFILEHASLDGEAEDILVQQIPLQPLSTGD